MTLMILGTLLLQMRSYTPAKQVILISSPQKIFSTIITRSISVIQDHMIPMRIPISTFFLRITGILGISGIYHWYLDHFLMTSMTITYSIPPVDLSKDLPILIYKC